MGWWVGTKWRAGSLFRLVFFPSSHSSSFVASVPPTSCPHSPQRHCQRKPHCRGVLVHTSFSHFPAQASLPTSNMSHRSPTEVQRCFDNGAFKQDGPSRMAAAAAAEVPNRQTKGDSHARGWGREELGLASPEYPG